MENAESGAVVLRIHSEMAELGVEADSQLRVPLPTQATSHIAAPSCVQCGKSGHDHPGVKRVPVENTA